MTPPHSADETGPDLNHLRPLLEVRDALNRAESCIRQTRALLAEGHRGERPEPSRELDGEWRSLPATRRCAAAAELLADRAASAQNGPLQGTWEPGWESCDCNDGLCSHGSYICYLTFNHPIVESAREPNAYDRQASTEIPTDALVYWLTVQPAVGLRVAQWLRDEATQPRPSTHATAVADEILALPNSGHAWTGGPNAVAAGLQEDPYTRRLREEGFIS